MKHICIVQTHCENFNYDDYTWVTDTITDWSEVSDEDFYTLRNYCSSKGWNIVERLDKEPSFIPKTIEEALAFAREEEELEKKRQEEADRKKQARLLKKKAKEEAAEKKLLEELLRKHGVD